VTSARGRNDPRIAATEVGKGPVGLAFASRKLVSQQGVTSFPVESAAGVMGCATFLGPKAFIRESLARALGAHVAAAWEVVKLRDESVRRQKDLQTAVAGLKSMERNREELLSNVSNELKNPLTTIKTYLALMIHGRLGKVSEEQLRALHTCERNAERLQRMVNDLLLLSRLQTAKMELHDRPFGLKAMAEEVTQVLAPLSDPDRGTIRIPPCSEVYVRGDRQRIFEAVYNLMENALLHSESTRSVDVTVSSLDGFAQLEVRDHGIGISEQELEHLFDPFHRIGVSEWARQAGAGLGLPIVAKIARLHGGRAEAESRLNEGSTFRLLLPMFAGPVSTTPVPAPRPGGILLVEDDDDSREVLRELLDQEGYPVLSADSARQALQLLEEAQPALALLDLHQRDGDGRTVLRHIRGTDRLKETAVYLISGASEVASLSAGQGLDRIDGFFEKPLQLPKLLVTLSSVVHPSRNAT
jgi:signal transduction histidine kinase/CheY-like chemotaxis protein